MMIKLVRDTWHIVLGVAVGDIIMQVSMFVSTVVVAAIVELILLLI